jgi:uroporphyrinogen-III synthase
VKASTGSRDPRSLLAEHNVDAIVFTSPSAIRFFIEGLGESSADALTSIPIAVIGPVAREALESEGLLGGTAVIQPERATIKDLVEAICRYFSNPERCI